MGDGSFGSLGPGNRSAGQENPLQPDGERGIVRYCLPGRDRSRPLLIGMIAAATALATATEVRSHAFPYSLKEYETCFRPFHSSPDDTNYADPIGIVFHDAQPSASHPRKATGPAALEHLRHSSNYDLLSESVDQWFLSHESCQEMRGEVASEEDQNDMRRHVRAAPTWHWISGLGYTAVATPHRELSVSCGWLRSKHAVLPRSGGGSGYDDGRVVWTLFLQREFTGGQHEVRTVWSGATKAMKQPCVNWTAAGNGEVTLARL